MMVKMRVRTRRREERRGGGGGRDMALKTRTDHELENRGDTRDFEPTKIDFRHVFEYDFLLTLETLKIY